MMMMREEKEKVVRVTPPMSATFYYKGVYTSLELNEDGEFSYYDHLTSHIRFPFANLVAFCKAGGKVSEPKVVEKPEPDRRHRCVECKHLDWEKVKDERGPCLPSAGHPMGGRPYNIFSNVSCRHFAPAPVGCGNAEQAMLQELIRKTKESGDND